MACSKHSIFFIIGHFDRLPASTLNNTNGYLAFGLMQ